MLVYWSGLENVIRNYQATQFRRTLDNLIEELNFLDWRINVVRDYLESDGLCWVEIGTFVQDSYNPEREEKLPFGREVRLAVGMTEEQVCRELAFMLMALTEHEVFEFFQRNGRPVFSPHDSKNAPHLELDSRYRIICGRDAQNLTAAKGS